MHTCVDYDVRFPAPCESVRIYAACQVIEAHPQHEVPDLRVLAPPAELNAFINERYSDLSALTSTQYAHVPFVVLLLKAAQQWSSANLGAVPTTYAQKKEIREIIESFRRKDVQADQNIDEALNAVNTAFSKPSPHKSLAALLSKARGRVSELAAELRAAIASPEESSTSLGMRRQQLSFWMLCAGVAAFVDGEGGGLLPTAGVIPDMVADTATYVALQTIYQQQSLADMQSVHAHVQQVCTMESLPADLIPIDVLKPFCKNALNLEVIDYTTIEGEYTAANGSASIAAALDDGASSGTLYVLLRAAQAFRAERSFWPGEDDFSVESDMPVLKQFVTEVAKELGLSTCAISDDLVHEFCRWGGSELHSIASVMGGIASQEAIKAITRQYVPCNNTFIFNGMTGTTSSLKL